ncbi:MAG: tetratricopeptide repeat protein [Tetrasphaera sp.]|nr:tetratricopeptide repeat protein [Tetrasphaera sp.]
MSLNNLSVQRSENGDRPEALAAIEEAATLRPALAQAAPAVYTPNLAMSLNNLSNRRSENGDRPGALAAIEEAVTLYRALAQAAPAVYTPDLAMSLNNLSVRRSENGDRPGALAAIEEAVTLYRALAQAAPAVYTPNLAMSLNNLSVQRSENGDRPGALAAIEEAVTLYRALAQAAPAVYTPDLAMSLNNLSNRLREGGASEEDSIRPWTTAMAELPHIAAAELRLALARRLGARQPDQGTSLLSAAAAAADSVDVATADRGTRLVALRLRRELRGYVQQDGSELSVADREALPAWATLPLPEASLRRCPPSARNPERRPTSTCWTTTQAWFSIQRWPNNWRPSPRSCRKRARTRTRCGHSRRRSSPTASMSCGRAMPTCCSASI